VKLFGFCSIALLWPFLSTSLAFAGHPMIVDDASIVDVKTCQFESWMDRDSKSATFWILPACNFTGNLELTVGGAWTHKAGSTRNTEVGLQGKTIFKSLDSNGWGLGLAAGALWHPKDNSNHRTYELYARLPVSFSFNDDRLLVHGNIGWNHNSADRENNLLWGVAAETEVTKPLFLFAEVFGRERGHPVFHFGFWYWIVPERLHINAAYGNRFGTPPDGYFFSVGFTMFTVPFLP
jgi:hypothetical protein